MKINASQTEKNYLCPKCRTAMNTVASHGVEVEACPSCLGIWTDFIDDKHFLKILPSALTIDEIRRLRKLYEPLGVLDPVKYLKCPVCQDLMYRRNWGGYSGVIVDRCEAHGTWYDALEPEKIREYVALGGLDFEKLTHHDRATGDVSNKLSKEVSRLDSSIIANRHLISRIWNAMAY